MMLVRSVCRVLLRQHARARISSARVVAKPDNVPIVMMVYLVGFFWWLAMYKAIENDEAIEKGRADLREERGRGDKIFTWPDLVFTEFICMVILTVGMVVWSIVLPAPLEEPANSSRSLPTRRRRRGISSVSRRCWSISTRGWRGGAAHPDHHRADGDPVHRHQPEGQRLLHLQRAQGPRSFSSCSAS